MQLTDFAREVPEEVRALFAPLLPPVRWCGNGRPPASNRECLPGLFYVLVTGIAWRMLPTGFPSYTAGGLSAAGAQSEGGTVCDQLLPFRETS